MSRRRQRTQPPLFTQPCPVCRFPTDGEHEPWCPSFMRGAEPGGDPSEWSTLFDTGPMPVPLDRKED